MTSTAMRLAAAALVAGAMAACGASQEPLPVSDVSGVRLAVQWRMVATDTGHFAYRAREFAGVAVEGDTVVAATSSGRLMGVDARSGAVRWTVDYDEALSAAPVVLDGVVYVGGPDGTVRAIDVAGGTERWRHRASTAFSTPATVTEDAVYICGADATVYALERATGRMRWRFERPPANDMTMLGDCRPAVDGTSVIAGFHDGSLARIDESGASVWLRDLARGSRRLVDVDGRPLVVDDVVIAASYRGGIFAFDRLDGAPRWDIDVEGAVSPQRVGDLVVTGTSAGDVLWIDPADGSVVHALSLGGGAVGEIVTMGGWLLVPTSIEGIFVVDADAPWIHGQFSPDSGFSSALATSGSHVFALSDGGYLYGLLIQSL